MKGNSIRFCFLFVSYPNDAALCLLCKEQYISALELALIYKEGNIEKMQSCSPLKYLNRNMISAYAHITNLTRIMIADKSLVNQFWIQQIAISVVVFYGYEYLKCSLFKYTVPLTIYPTKRKRVQKGFLFFRIK